MSSSDRDEPRVVKDGERMVYGLALVVAVVAGITAMASSWSDDEETPASTSAVGPETAASEAAASETEPPSGRMEVEPPTKGTRRAGDDFVPSLPEVPDLATQPPPPRPARRDPRMGSLTAEMRILNRARELLAEHPAEALGVIAEHRRQHPQGVLREEREAFAIEALLDLEHSAEAERRYYDFLRDYPESNFRERLRERMSRPPHALAPR